MCGRENTQTIINVESIKKTRKVIIKKQNFMKKSILFLCAALVMIFTSCSQEFGDQKEVNGKPRVLSLTIKGSNVKTRAAVETGFVNGDENDIKDILVFAFDGSDNYTVAPQYFPSTAFTPAGGEKFTIEVQITTSTTKILVVSNLGSPTDTNSKAYDLFEQIKAEAGTNTPTYTNLSAATFDLDEVNNTTGNLLQSGESAIDATIASPAAAIILTYVNSRISVEEVKLFGAIANEVEANENGTPAQKAVAAKGWDKIALDASSPIFILNATKESSLVGRAASTVTDVSAFYNGIDATGWSDGVYFSVAGTEPSSDILSYATSEAIPNSSTEYPYFYVWANPTVLTSSQAGATLVVISATITIGGIDSRVYYSIPVYTGTAINTDYDNNVLNRNTHYHIKADISAMGSPNPYDKLVNAIITITPSTYVEGTTVTYTFPN